MSNPFFDHPILNSPYGYPRRHWERDEAGQPTQKIIESRRSAKFITPIPKPKKHKAAPAQTGFAFDEGKGLSTKEAGYTVRSLEWPKGDRDRDMAKRACAGRPEKRMARYTRPTLAHLAMCRMRESI